MYSLSSFENIDEIIKRTEILCGGVNNQIKKAEKLFDELKKMSDDKISVLIDENISDEKLEREYKKTCNEFISVYGTNNDDKYNVMVIGDSKTGKTCLVQCLSEGINFKIPEHYQLSFKEKFCYNLNLYGKSVPLDVFDTNGDPEDDEFDNLYYKTNGFLLCFDITNRDTFANLNKWWEKIKKESKDDSLCLLIGCKSDCVKRAVSTEEATIWAEEHSIKYIDTSAKDIKNVKEAFRMITNSIIYGSKK